MRVVAWTRTSWNGGLETRAGQEEGAYQGRGGNQLDSSKDGGNMIEYCKKPIQDVMQQGQWPTE